MKRVVEWELEEEEGSLNCAIPAKSKHSEWQSPPPPAPPSSSTTEGATASSRVLHKSVCCICKQKPIKLPLLLMADQHPMYHFVGIANSKLRSQSTCLCVDLLSPRGMEAAEIRGYEMPINNLPSIFRKRAIRRNMRRRRNRVYQWDIQIIFSILLLLFLTIFH